MTVKAAPNFPERKYLWLVPMLVSSLVLSCCLMVTWWLWLNEQQNSTQVLQAKFDYRMNDFENLTITRIRDYGQVLLGVRGLFEASGAVTRGEFRNYVATLKLAKNFPGAQGVGYSVIVPAKQKNRHIAAVRKEGFPDYTIKPETSRDFYTTTIFLEPFSGRNELAFGFDNFTDATLRVAMEEARDSGELSISGKVAQPHEMDAGQNTIRMYLPVYRNGVSTLTVEDRRKNIIGWLYLPIRMNDFMKDALGIRIGKLDIEIYDGNSMSADTFLYDSDSSNSHPLGKIGPLFKTITTINIHGHPWTLAAQSLPDFDAKIAEGKQRFFIYAGTGISLLLAFLAGLLMNAQARARRDALVVVGSEERLSAVIETALDAVIQMDAGGRVIGWNSQAEIVFGYSRESAMGQVLEELVIPTAHRNVFRTSMSKFLVAPESFTISSWGKSLNARSELFAKRRDGSEFPIELSMTQNTLDDGSYQFTAFIRDITRQHEREAAQRLSSNVLDTVEEAVVLTDTENKIVRVNPAFSAITGYTAKEAIGKNPSLLSSGKHPPEFYREMWGTLDVKGIWQGEIWNRRKSGAAYVEWLTIKALRDEKGALTHYLGVFSDISERKAAEERMRRLAHHDILTDLPNRVLFNDRLRQSMSRVRRDLGHMALMFIDLDNFKPVNDTYGHTVGDLLLKEVAARLLDCVRESDTVSRIGGDEFVVLLSAIEFELDAMRVAGKVLNALSEPFDLDGKRLSISASIGIAIYPEHGEDELLLTKNADIAMYHAKHGGRNNAKVFQPGMEEA